MPTQLALSFDAVLATCEVQQRYHSIAPCLAGISTPAEQAHALNVGVQRKASDRMSHPTTMSPKFPHRDK